MSVGSPPSVLESEGTVRVTGRVAESIGICHVTSGDRWAGADVQCHALLKALRKSPELRVSAIFLNDGRPADEARRCGIEVCTFDETRQSFWQILSGAARFVKSKNIQVLHSHRYKENLLAAMLARRCRIPAHVVTRHGAPEPFEGWRSLKQGFVQQLDVWVTRYSADRIICVSDELRAQLGGVFPEAKTVAIHNGLDAEGVFSPLSRAEAKRRLDLPTDCFVIGTAGRLDPIKRLDIFLQAATQIAAAEPNVRFVIAGEGTEGTRLRSTAVDLGLKDLVMFLGHRDDVYDVLRAMDLFVMCSDHEGLPMALLEALYLHVPVIARPVGGIPEVIRDGVSGVLVESSAFSDLAAACVALLRDESRRRRLAEAGAEAVAKDFTTSQTGIRVIELYESLTKVARPISSGRSNDYECE